MTNRALVYRSFGPPEHHLKLEKTLLSDRPTGKLRVAMIQAPINPSDLIPVTGAYAHRVSLPAVAGYEGVGRVIDAPPDYSCWIGRRVLPLRGAGTWQTHVDSDPALAIPVPDRISDDVAARAYINPLAAQEMLRAVPVAGKRVLLCGAGSSCADLLGHLARQEGAAEVIGIYRSEGRIERMRSLGVTPVSANDEKEVIRHARAADVTFDALGGPLASRVLEAMAQGTRFVGYGLLSGESISPAAVPRARYERFHLRDRLQRMDHASWKEAFESVWSLLAEVALPPACVHPLENWREAIHLGRKPGSAKQVLQFKMQAP
ncbi:zinc-dependent alcohol dehydrogenase family protein [Roseicyclus sp. F158]|uniref:Zinc-dependent alcohol dehydrogenase family protein n=1 Tax=Tropicimonas omnivorans TaxID=3075590 RepID=A0ABU3DNE3_9RHOB|nr:zinc-dependent alcohol dehydrogenase family protein [Roseicyclus sp. F158]MDT0684597.1 zinc-dependent alcohol dehydrogenase family protein [Roseicyclus sp. F158]